MRASYRGVNFVRRFALLRDHYWMPIYNPQERSDKNKLYSLHEPHVVCIAKGKAHKKYEFGSKVSVGSDQPGMFCGRHALSTW